MNNNRYSINEEVAKAAKTANSFDDYGENSATDEYIAILEEFEQAVEKLVEDKAKRAFPMTDDMSAQVRSYADSYSRKLAAAINRKNTIDARVPSIMITGAGNFAVNKKNKQNVARDKFWQECGELFNPTANYYYDKIRTLLTSNKIYDDDARAIEKLQFKLETLEKNHFEMKALNAYYRKHNTVKGYGELSDAQAAKIDADLETAYNRKRQPYPPYVIASDSAEIKRIKERIATITKLKQNAEKPAEEKYPTIVGVKVVENAEIMRVQLFFEDKPDDSVRALLKSHGFRWAPSVGAWQRQLTPNGIFAAKMVLKQLNSDDGKSV